MAKVRETPEGVRVTGCVQDFSGKPMVGATVKVTLPTTCTWRGKIIASVFNGSTDSKGCFELWLPPTRELVALRKTREPLEYFVVIEGVAAWNLIVPGDIVSMQIGGGVVRANDDSRRVRP